LKADKVGDDAANNDSTGSDEAPTSPPSSPDLNTATRGDNGSEDDVGDQGSTGTASETQNSPRTPQRMDDAESKEELVDADQHQPSEEDEEQSDVSSSDAEQLPEQEGDEGDVSPRAIVVHHTAKRASSDEEDCDIDDEVIFHGRPRGESVAPVGGFTYVEEVEEETHVQSSSDEELPDSPSAVVTS